MGYKDKIQNIMLGDGEPDPQTQDPEDDYGFFGSPSDGNIRRTKPPKDDLQKYWRQYEHTGIVRKAINTYINDIIEPGYQVSCDDEELERRLNSWLEEAAIVNGEQDKDFLFLLEDFLRQREVRGTGMVEVVPKKSDVNGIWGFRLINIETVHALEDDDTGVLIRPNETERQEAVQTRRGEAAAYIQYDDTAFAGPFDRDDVPLSQNDVVKMVLDGDAYDIFGTSRLESVSRDIEIRRKILEDNQEAIAAKGHPHWIFKMGEPNPNEENPRRGVWPDDKIQDLRDEHKDENFSAGQKDFLPGDVDVDVVHGETADIKDTLMHHNEEILSAMPVPKFMIGHADSVNRDITTEQNKNYLTQVQKVRNEVESVFTPALRRKAAEWGYDTDVVDSVELRIERETHESPLRNEEFDAQEFKAMAEGIRSMEKSDAISTDELRENILGLPAEQDEDTSQEPASNDSEDEDNSDEETGSDEQEETADNSQEVTNDE